MKNNLIFVILLNIILTILCQEIKLGSGKTKTIEEKLKEDDDLNKYEEDHSIEDKMKIMIKEYIQDQNWKEDQQIDKETFKKMFVYIIQRDALRQGSSALLKKLADKIVQKNGEPIIVKNLGKYFDIMELTLEYSRILNPNQNTDL